MVVEFGGILYQTWTQAKIILNGINMAGSGTFLNMKFHYFSNKN